MPTYAVLGAGLMGRAAARDLLQSQPDASVTLMDANPRSLEEAAAFVADRRLSTERLDLAQPDRAAAALAGHEAAIGALPHSLSLSGLRAAIRARTSIVDLVGEAPEPRIALEPEARAAGIVIVPSCGVAPGLSNVFAAQGIEALDEADDAVIYVGGVPRSPRPPLDYATVYRLESMFEACVRPARVLVGGRERKVDALSGLETLEFAAPIGRLEAYVTDGLGSVIVTLKGRLAGRLEEKTLRYPGFVDKVRFLRDCGLLETTPVRIGDVEVAPVSVLIARLEPLLRLGPDGDYLVMRVVVTGKADGRPATRTFELIDAYDPETGYTAMARTTCFPATTAARMIAAGEIAEPGVHFPEQLFVGERGAVFIQRLVEHGLRIRRT